MVDRAEPTPGPAREYPVLDDLNRAYWTGGARGELRIQRCERCDLWLHPPRARCPRCLSGPLAFAPVSGRGRVYSFSVVHHAYRPGLAVPYVVALVELVERPGLRITTNVVDCDPRDVAIGLEVQVAFEAGPDGKFVPLFKPASP